MFCSLKSQEKSNRETFTGDMPMQREQTASAGRCRTVCREFVVAVLTGSDAVAHVDGRHAIQAKRAEKMSSCKSI